MSGKSVSWRAPLPFTFTDGVERGDAGNFAAKRGGPEPDGFTRTDVWTSARHPITASALAWTSAQGFGTAYEAEERGWLRTFGGGLVATCGLMNAGAPTDDAWGRVGLHDESERRLPRT